MPSTLEITLTMSQYLGEHSRLHTGARLQAQSLRERKRVITPQMQKTSVATAGNGSAQGGRKDGPLRLPLSFHTREAKRRDISLVSLEDQDRSGLKAGWTPRQKLIICRS